MLLVACAVAGALGCQPAPTELGASATSSASSTASTNGPPSGSSPPAWVSLPTPPALVVRERGGQGPTSFVELGGAAPRRVPFERDPDTGAVALAGGVTLPLNLYGDESTHVRFVLRFDQSLATDPANPSRETIELLWRDDLGREQRLGATLALRANTMVGGGAEVSVEPRGILPQGRPIEVRLTDALRGLSGQSGARPGLAVLSAETMLCADPVTGQPISATDVFLERFDGTDWFDASASSPDELAVVAHGSVSGSSTFPGGGGPGGNFDFVVRTGQTLLFDTSFQLISGGPGGNPTTVQEVRDGRLFVRDLHIDAGATLQLVGPHPLRVFATRDVRIDGLLSAEGGSNQGVTTLNTTNIPEPGAPGHAGGGNGGTGSTLTTASTPRGGAGFGAFQVAGRGGEGGETSYHAQSLDGRRGAGGGGGRFATDVRYRWNGLEAFCQTLIGFDAEPGFPGGALGLGAESQSARAAGGAIAPSVFTDGNPANDFVGAITTGTGTMLGELNGLWAGAGGGAGGDAVTSSTFPLTPFSPSGDEKGGGGGGGGGAIAVMARRLTIGATGRICADGGHGGPGENTFLFDRTGGAGAGGSGGMILLESAIAVQVDALTAQGTGFNQALPFYTDNPAQLRHPARPISALGGQGGAGKDDRCGANAIGAKDWKVDAIPIAAFEGRTDVPPLGETPGNNSFLNCNTGSPTDPEGTTPGAGGDGSPGLIQVHVPASLANFSLPPSAGGDPTFSFAPPPVGWSDGAFVGRLEPRFAGLSSIMSAWIALGGAGWDPVSRRMQPLDFLLPGLDADGYVEPSATGHGVVDTTALPPGHRIRVSFDAARATPEGEVALETSLTATRGALTNDRNVLNGAPFEFIRFRIDFERPVGAPTQPLAVDALRVPFRF